MKISFGKWFPALVAALVVASFAMAPYADAAGSRGWWAAAVVVAAVLAPGGGGGGGGARVGRRWRRSEAGPGQQQQGRYPHQRRPEHEREQRQQRQRQPERQRRG